MIDKAIEAISEFEIKLPILIILIVFGTMAKILYDRVVNHYFSEIQRRRTEVEANINSLVLPLVSISFELDERIAQIVGFASEKNWLSVEISTEVKNGRKFVSDTHDIGYYYLSTVYIFAKYFAFVGLFRDEASRIGIGYSKELARTVECITEVSETLRSTNLFDRRPDFEDTNSLHRHIQEAIGEQLVVPGEGTKRVMTFSEFIEKYKTQDGEFFYWMTPIEGHIVGLAGIAGSNPIEKIHNSQDYRFLRLLLMRKGLISLLLSIKGQVLVEKGDLEKKLIYVKSEIDSYIAFDRTQAAKTSSH